MKTIQHILCPTDFSDSSAKAMKYAEQLAIEADARLTLIHAFDIPAEWSLAGQEHPRDERLEQQINGLLVDSPLGSKLQRLQHAGEAAKVICWTAQDRGCDLIVIGAHGKSGLKHLLFGSVAKEVLQMARCPVLTVRDINPNESPIPQPIVMPIPPPRFM